MKNCINELMRDTEGAHAKAGLLKKMAWCLMSLGIRHQITNWIEEVKVLMVEVNARHDRYKIDECINSSLGIVVWIHGC